MRHLSWICFSDDEVNPGLFMGLDCPVIEARNLPGFWTSSSQGRVGNTDIKLQITGDSANVDWEVCGNFLGRRNDCQIICIKIF